MGERTNPELQIVTGETGHKYFHQMLNMADDDLNPHEYRLLGHYLRWAGHGGERKEGIRQTAKVCHMGQTAVRKHRAALAEKGYLRLIEPTPEQLKEGEPTKIIVLDRWAENIARYTQTDTPPVSKQIQGSPKPVSKQIHPPVSKQIHKEEPSLEEQKTKEEQKESSSPHLDGVLEMMDQYRDRFGKVPPILEPQLEKVGQALTKAEAEAFWLEFAENGANSWVYGKHIANSTFERKGLPIPFPEVQKPKTTAKAPPPVPTGSPAPKSAHNPDEPVVIPEQWRTKRPEVQREKTG